MTAYYMKYFSGTDEKLLKREKIKESREGLRETFLRENIFRRKTRYNNERQFLRRAEQHKNLMTTFDEVEIDETLKPLNCGTYERERKTRKGIDGD